MRLERNNQIKIQFKTFFAKLNPWIGLVGSLCLLIPSLYDILDEPFKITSDHFVLVVGLVFMIFFLKQIFERIINIEGME